LKRAGIIGGGAWGTALAQAAAEAGLETILWAMEPEVATAINSTHENSVFLAGVPLNENITATNEMADLKSCDFILMVCPAQFMRPVAKNLVKAISNGGVDGTPLVICSKGIEKTTGLLMSEVLAETVPNSPVAVLSGPTFAHEVAKGLPAAVTMAAEDLELAKALSLAIGRPAFRPYWTTDVIGAQIGGAIKNVLAIACGIIHGLDYGENARAALITRGLSEMVRFSDLKGGQHDTLMGLCGLGDLMLTCSSTQSRNMSLGSALGQGKTLEEIMAGRKTVAEGYHSAQIVYEIAKQANLDTPIIYAIYQILYEGRNVDESINDILNRPFAAETF
jgi:glycerol-3-phosphate dehydrogenase (NAD(P)+)